VRIFHQIRPGKTLIYIVYSITVLRTQVIICKALCLLSQTPIAGHCFTSPTSVYYPICQLNYHWMLYAGSGLHGRYLEQNPLYYRF
jgi:hypothetical protein